MPSHERDHFGINPTSPRCCDQDFGDNRLTVGRSVRSSRAPGRSAVSEDKFVDHVRPGRFATGFSNALMAKDVRLYVDWRRDRRHLGTLRGRSAEGGLHGGLLVPYGPVSGSRPTRRWAWRSRRTGAEVSRRQRVPWWCGHGDSDPPHVTPITSSGSHLQQSRPTESDSHEGGVRCEPGYLGRR